MLVLNIVDVKEVNNVVAEDVFVVRVVDMLAIMEEFWAVDVFVRGVVMPVENLDEGVPVDNAVGVVGKLLPVGEPCTLRDVICCEILLVEETEGVAVIFVEVVSVVVDMLSLGIGMLAEKVGAGVAVEIVDRSVSMFVTLEELWMVDVVFGGICIIADDIVVTAVVEECVEMLPQFSSQHNTLIS